MENLANTSASHLEAAQTMLAEDRHYLGAVVRLGDGHEVETAEDIVESHGIKLLPKGTRIDSSILDKILGHRLRDPIDRHLTVTNSVSPTSLSRDVSAIMDSDVWWTQMAERSGDPLGIRHGLAGLELPSELCFKLTVAREQRPVLYQHSLRTALLAHYLALRLRLSSADTGRLLLAALFHDFGELHTDPAIFAPAHRIGDQERRFIYVHPITGYLVLKQIPGVDPQVAKAVLHHQERLDGSGYPYGLRSDAISPLARILTVADVAASVLARFTDHRRLSTLLRFNPLKYDTHAVAALHELLAPGHVPNEDRQTLSPSALSHRLAAIAELLTGWTRVRRTMQNDGAPIGEAELTFLFERLHSLNTTLLQFGFDPDSFGILLSLAEEDPEIAAELAAVLDETRFQLAEMSQEIERRETAGQFKLPLALEDVFADWRKSLIATAAG